MKRQCFALLLLLGPSVLAAQELVAPEVVRFEAASVEGIVRTVTVGNAKGHFRLSCNIEAAGCITPQARTNYLIFDGGTRWKMRGATKVIDLAFVQEWTVKYNTGENIGLVPEDGGGELGMYFIDRSAGDYQLDTVFSDGPIIYGTGMSKDGRSRAWKHFFMQMVEAMVRQQGQDALGVKLAKRCLPGQDFCTMALDANLTGIGGVQSPQKVILMVLTDVNDPDQQLSRAVCTRPRNGAQVCRDWDSGKLITGDATTQ